MPTLSAAFHNALGNPPDAKAYKYDGNMIPQISGIFTPNIVPLDDRGQINEDELRRYVEWLIPAA